MSLREKSRSYAFGPTTVAGGAGGVLPLNGLPAQFDEVNIAISLTAMTGAQTLALTYDVSPDGGTTWIVHTAFTNMTATGTQLLKIAANIGKYARISYTATGAATSSTFTVWFEGKRFS